MGSNNLVLLCTLVLMLFGFSSSNLDQDRAECADQLVGLATCLPYVGGDAKAPTIDCCSGFKQVMEKSPKCLCILIKDRNDPNLGLKINATLAMRLPSACHSPANITQCISLLHLAPNSTDAKMFEEFSKNNDTSNTATPVTSANSTSKGTSAEAKSQGGLGKRLMIGKMVSAVLPFIFTSHVIFYFYIF